MTGRFQRSVIVRAAGAAVGWIWLVVLVAATAVFSSGGACAHEVRPAYLSVQEMGPNEFSVLFKTPMQGNARLALTALFSGKIEEVTPVVSYPTGDAMVQTWRMRTMEPQIGRAHV